MFTFGSKVFPPRGGLWGKSRKTVLKTHPASPTGPGLSSADPQPDKGLSHLPLLQLVLQAPRGPQGCFRSGSQVSDGKFEHSSHPQLWRCMCRPGRGPRDWTVNGNSWLPQLSRAATGCGRKLISRADLRPSCSQSWFLAIRLRFARPSVQKPPSWSPISLPPSVGPGWCSPRWSSSCRQ